MYVVHFYITRSKTLYVLAWKELKKCKSEHESLKTHMESAIVYGNKIQPYIYVNCVLRSVNRATVVTRNLKYNKYVNCSHSVEILTKLKVSIC